MSSPSLDTNKPYGKVTGQIEGYAGAKFTQNGDYYDVSGKLILFSMPGTDDVRLGEFDRWAKTLAGKDGLVELRGWMKENLGIAPVPQNKNLGNLLKVARGAFEALIKQEQ